MDLLFDYRAYQDFYKRGVGRYVEELFGRAILLNKEGTNTILINPDKEMPAFSEEIQRLISKHTVKDFNDGKVNQEFDVFINGSSTVVNLPRINAIDYLYPEAVINRAKYKVCILHDFVPLYYRHFIPTKRDEINYLLECEALKYMDHIFTNSKFVADSGAELLGRPIEDFTPLYGGADTGKFKTQNTGKKYSREGRTHDIVNVSDVCPRKNYKGVTEAFCRAYLSKEIPEDARLVFICSAPKEFKRAIKSVTKKYKLKYGQHVVTTGYVLDEEMAAMIGNAMCSIFPSFYEGLGLPILESYAAGTPCITANATSTKELAIRDALFEPEDVENMKEKIILAYSDNYLMERDLEHGQQLLNRLNWDNSAQKMYGRMHHIVKSNYVLLKERHNKDADRTTIRGI